MGFPANLVPDTWQWLFNIAFALVFVQSLRHAPWDYLTDRRDSNILFASVVVVWLAWQLRASIPGSPGLELHLLMATSVTLMFGWSFAFMVVCAVQALMTIQGVAAWESFGAVVVVNGALPIGMTLLVYGLARRYLPRHFFIYIFVCCFGAGAVSMLASRLAGMVVLLSSDHYTAFQLQADGYFLMLPIAMFPEAFVNGVVMTMLVVFKPQWVGSFRDQQYLRGK